RRINRKPSVVNWAEDTSKPAVAAQTRCKALQSHRLTEPWLVAIRSWCSSGEKVSARTSSELVAPVARATRSAPVEASEILTSPSSDAVARTLALSQKT